VHLRSFHNAGGSAKDWPLVQVLLQSIAAMLEDGNPCCHDGNGGAALVKMVHIRIEYGDMQLIAKPTRFSLSRKRIRQRTACHSVRQLEQSDMDSFLIEILPISGASLKAVGSYLVVPFSDVPDKKERVNGVPCLPWLKRPGYI
jgi:6-phosphogluconate dehydrogenase